MEGQAVKELMSYLSEISVFAVSYIVARAIVENFGLNWIVLSLSALVIIWGYFAHRKKKKGV